MAGIVRAIVSKKTLEFTPDSSSDSSELSSNGESEFDITVINDSDKFASFQVELTAPGVDVNSTIKWYRVEPEICAKKPPGSETKFHVAITKAPIPAYDTTIDLVLQVFSVEFANLYTSQKLKLTIKKPLRSLRIYLPVKEHKVSPGDGIEIPVIIYNLSPKFTEITLNCLGLDREWLSEGTERKLLVEPGDSEKTTFWCQPPRDTQTLSKKYNFTIDAKCNTSHYTTRDQGIVEVLPQGVLEFSCSEKLQTIPTKGGKQPNSATYKLEFKNDSNLPQQVNIHIPAADEKKCDFIIPDGVNIAPGETQQMYLLTKKKRPWLGIKQRLLFEVSPVLNNPNSGEPSTEIFPKPSIQILELDILPIIPFLLQLGGGIVLLLLLSLNWWLNPKAYHTGRVNSVRLVGNGGQVVSGSSDQTIRLWQVDRSPWQTDIRRLKYEGTIADNITKAVRVIRKSPREDYIVASGLENGDIQLWDVLSKDKPKTIYSGNDRVFDLGFTEDSRYLFSGHGSSIVRQWNLESLNKKPINQKSFNFAISTLAISENQPGSPVVAVAGQYNKLALWDLDNNSAYNIQYNIIDNFEDKEKSRNNTKFKPILGKNHYINSLVTASNLLASADNQGYITLWDMNQRQCLVKSPPSVIKKNNYRKVANNTKTRIQEQIECEISIIDQWRDGHSNEPVRSVALTQNGCYLASAGDDGRVVLWPLKKGKRTSERGQEVANFSGVRINSVDIKALNDYVLVTSGDDNNHVRLYRISGMNDNASCK